MQLHPMKGFDVVCYDDDLDKISILKKKKFLFMKKAQRKI